MNKIDFWPIFSKNLFRSKINLKNVPKDPFDFDDPFDFPSTSSKSDDFGFESVLQNHHLLRILLKRFNETNDTSVQKLIDYSYELKRLFPHGEIL